MDAKVKEAQAELKDLHKQLDKVLNECMHTRFKTWCLVY